MLPDQNQDNHLDHLLEHLLDDQPLQPLPNHFVERLVDRVAALPQDPVLESKPLLAEIFAWQDVALAMMITLLATGGILGGFGLLAWIGEAISALIGPTEGALLMMVLAAQVIIISFVVWLLFDDEDPLTLSSF